MNGIWIESLGVRHPDECGVYNNLPCDCFLKDALVDKEVPISTAKMIGKDPDTGYPIYE